MLRALEELGYEIDALLTQAGLRREDVENPDIAEVAYLLGYSEPTAFHRAFKRWHRTTPHAFRSRYTPAT